MKLISERCRSDVAVAGCKWDLVYTKRQHQERVRVHLYLSKSKSGFALNRRYCGVYLHWSNLKVKATSLCTQVVWVATEFGYDSLRVVPGFVMCCAIFN